MNSKLFLLTALAAVMMIASATAQGGPCPGGFWPDASGCCPQLINGFGYYRDVKNQCYPKSIGGHVFYADSNGYHLHLASFLTSS
jgi:hypothetical protein